MHKKEERLEGTLKPMPHFNIDLKVDALKEGKYTLRLLDKNKTIKKITFKK